MNLSKSLRKTLRAGAVGVMSAAFTMAGGMAYGQQQSIPAQTKASSSTGERSAKDIYNADQVILYYDINNHEIIKGTVTGWKNSDGSNPYEGITRVKVDFATNKNKAMDINANNTAVFVNKMDLSSTNSRYKINADVDLELKSSPYNYGKKKDVFDIIPEPTNDASAVHNMPYSLSSVSFKGHPAVFLLVDKNGKPFDNPDFAAADLMRTTNIYGMLLDNRSVVVNQTTELNGKDKNGVYQNNISLSYEPNTVQPSYNNSRPPRRRP